MLIYPYKMSSGSARDLAKALGVTRVREDSRLINRPRRTVLNWGNPRLPAWGGNNTRWINSPTAVFAASDKLSSFQLFSQAGVAVPEWTTSRQVAEQWLAGGSIVVARTVLKGSGGIGIHIAERGGEALRQAPLYVKYIKKQHEYRVHVVNGQVIDTQIKKKRNGVERETTRIRNLANGYIFAREGIEADLRRDTLATQAVQSLNLDFGAVDILYNRHNDSYHVLEVNTAPGLEGTTLNNYVNAMRAYQ